MFDLDGTLVDHEGAARQGVVRWLTGEKLATQQQCNERLVALWDEVAERHFLAFRAGAVTFQEQRRRRLRDFLPHVGLAGQDMDDSALDGRFEQYLRHYEAAWRPYDDALPALESLRGTRLAVLSNGDQTQQEDKLRRTGLDRHFEAVLTSSSLGAAKPNPEAFRLACARLDAHPATVVYVGDNLDVDARAATAAGLLGVWLDRHCGTDPDHKPTISSLAALPLVVRGDVSPPVLP